MLSVPGWKNPDAIGFFFGAGASIEFGIPSMTEMTRSFAAKIRDASSLLKERKVFDDIYSSLAKVYGEDGVDLEAIMSVIVGLKEGYIKDNIGDLGLFALAKKGDLDFLDFQIDRAILDRLENEYRKYIRSKVIVPNSGKIDYSRKVYTDFFKQICNVSTCDNATAPDTDLGKFRYKKWTFFTTNYDNVLEGFWVEERGNHDLDLGFKSKHGKRIMNPDQFLRSNTKQFNVISALQLVKLHGSVNWTKNKDNDIEEHDYHLNLENIRSRRGSKDITDDLLIYPLTKSNFTLHHSYSYSIFSINILTNVVFG
jgi:hypothetical protein